MPNIKTTFTLYTPESIDNGDYEECGWIDEEGYEIDPDEDQTVAEAAIEFLKDKYVEHASSSHYYPGLWYTTPKANDGTRDFYEKGHVEDHSFHLDGFTEDQEREIAKAFGVIVPD